MTDCDKDAHMWGQNYNEKFWLLLYPEEDVS